MRHSKFFSVDPNFLIEYIYDDDNIVGEPYNILVDTRTGVQSFVSTDILRPPIRGYVQTNNDPYNQLFKIQDNLFAKLPSIGDNKLSEQYPYLQFKNYSSAIPIRYDKIRVHLPVNYTFGTGKGFYLRVYTLDISEEKAVELSNYYFDISDIEQGYKLEFSSNLLYILGQQWGKYLEVQIPSVTKVSDQINPLQSQFVNQQIIPKENSINFNLSGGRGVSRNSPIFIDFRKIDSISTANRTKFFNLSSRITVTVAQTPEFENLGIRIEESQQGDFFIIYATYNSTQAEFSDYLDELLALGFKYMVKYIVDLWEEDIKTKTYTFVIQEDFAEEVEFRPIFKFTTTTASIDVKLQLINIENGSTIERRSSYSLLQGGGQMMGSQPEGRITTGNKSGGGGDISKYAKNLSKINLKVAKRVQVTNFKDIIAPDTDPNKRGTQPILTLEKRPFVLYSSSYNVIDDVASHYVRFVGEQIITEEEIQRRLALQQSGPTGSQGPARSQPLTD